MTDRVRLDADTDVEFGSESHVQEPLLLRALVDEGLAGGSGTPVAAEDREELRAIASGRIE